jgi:hypothetical protein
MKRIIIICEGETEKEFCSKILAPALALKGIHVLAPLIKKSMGGIVNWGALKKQIELHLKQDKNAFVTTLIDYYGLTSNYKFPLWDSSLSIADKNKRMDFLEKAMLDDVDPSLKNRFIPYIQLHEFEGLLFNDINVFYNQIPHNDLQGRKELEEIFKNYSNPEMINNNKDTSPSYRLKRIIKGYNKIVYGNVLAEAIGLQNIRNKSPRFNKWLLNIENI